MPSTPRGDYLVLGLDGEKRLVPCDLDDFAGSARIVMNDYLAIDGKVYKVIASKQAGGIALALRPRTCRWPGCSCLGQSGTVG